MDASAVTTAPPPFKFVPFDDGRLQINREFCDVLMQQGLTSFDAWFNFSGGEAVRRVGARSTVRVVLAPTKHAVQSTRGAGPTFYLKRYNCLPISEWLKTAARLSWPVWGAVSEFRSIQQFAALDIPTLTPVAYGTANGRSLLVTQSLDGFVSLREAWENQAVPGLPQALPRIVKELAAYARQMHAAGLQHQDFYLDHVLVPADDPAGGLRIIDLGRVRRASRLSQRWIVKDLAQLNFSARHISCRQRLIFLHHYLGRPLTAADRWLIRAVQMKSAWIGRHTRKHAL